MLISAAYDGVEKIAVLKFYVPETQKLILWKDETGHKPYCYSRLNKTDLSFLNERDDILSIVLKFVHVDHFIPWSFIPEDEAWNLVLACNECNCKKSDSLAQKTYLDSLIGRNHEYGSEIADLAKSLQDLDADAKTEVKRVRGNQRSYRDTRTVKTMDLR